MKIITTISELDAELSAAKTAHRSVGLVPTMGALHSGHMSLVKRSTVENDITVVSIFVNPTQFNDKTDLASYPRTPEADCQLLEKEGATIAFVPSVETMYPEPDTRRFSYSPTDTVMEGGRRPGHFNGVCQIVSKLFMLVKPDKAYFGEKDFQQIAVIKAMVKDLRLPVEICACPIVREASGLALSSRNQLLSPAEKALAANIYRTLKESVDYAKTHAVSDTQQHVMQTLNEIDGLRVEYFEIVNGDTLQSVSSWEEAPYIVGCITVFCGSRPVRLIDNIKYKTPC